MNKFSLALLSLLLSFPCVANIDGTFIQTWLYSYWDDERGDDEIASMKEIGIKEIIMADIASRNNGNEPWLCNYPSHLPNTNLSANETTKILKHAKKGGIKVYLGLGCDNRWWNWNLCNDNDYQEFDQSKGTTHNMDYVALNKYKKSIGEEKTMTMKQKNTFIN